MTDERNPYAAPANPVVSAPAAAREFNAEDVVLADPPHARLAGEGAAWVSEGWELFKRQPMPLVVLSLAYVVLEVVASMALGLVPVAGGVVGMALNMLLVAGIVLGADRLYRGEEISLEYLFAGFSHPARVRLAVLGLVAGLLYLGTGVLAAWMSDMLPFWMASSGLAPEVDLKQMITSGEVGLMSILLMVCYAMLFSVPVTMAIWFATATVLFHQLSPVAAMAHSFRACLRNLLPLTVWSLLFGLFAVASIFTLFLAWIVLFPLLMTSWYISYRRVCTDLAATTTA